jgi:hypothetical protein
MGLQQPTVKEGQPMAENTKRYRTQWSAQFYVAAELTRRGHLAALTLGNAPETDLLVKSPGGTAFRVDVKGLSSRNFWLIRERPSQPDLFFVLVYMPPSLAEPPEYFVLSSEALMNEIATLREKTISAGRAWPETGSGINFGTGLQFKDQWTSLPA